MLPNKQKESSQKIPFRHNKIVNNFKAFEWPKIVINIGCKFDFDYGYVYVNF